MSFEGAIEMAINTSTINAHACVEIVDNFLIPFKENCFGDDEVIFQHDNLSRHEGKEIKAFIEKKKHIKSMTWLANNPDLYTIENLYWKFIMGSMKTVSQTNIYKLLFGKVETTLIKNITLN